LKSALLSAWATPVSVQGDTDESGEQGEEAAHDDAGLSTQPESLRSSSGDTCLGSTLSSSLSTDLARLLLPLLLLLLHCAAAAAVVDGVVVLVFVVLAIATTLGEAKLAPRRLRGEPLPWLVPRFVGDPALFLLLLLLFLLLFFD
jgi:hypothetical protein